MVDEDGALLDHEHGVPITDPGCPLPWHEGGVSRVEFSDDGTQVLSASEDPDDDTVLVWNIESGRRVRQLKGFEFALVEGLSDEHKKGRYILTVGGYRLRVYDCGKEEQYRGGGAGAAPVACFKAPKLIAFVRCHGAAICVVCRDGSVCILSAPFLTA
jgi:WD40 repeat protein